MYVSKTTPHWIRVENLPSFGKAACKLPFEEFKHKMISCQYRALYDCIINTCKDNTLCTSPFLLISTYVIGGPLKIMASIATAARMPTDCDPCILSPHTSHQMELESSSRWNETPEDRSPLPSADSGKDAWCFLAAGFVIEIMIWGTIHSDC
jgi:hypothetical protein